MVSPGPATRNDWRFTDRDTLLITCGFRAGSRSAVLAGSGRAICRARLFTTEIGQGLLVPLLSEFGPAPMPLQAVVPARRMVTS